MVADPARVTITPQPAGTQKSNWLSASTATADNMVFSVPVLGPMVTVKVPAWVQ